MPRLEEWEIKKYWEIFQGLGPVNNKLTGEKVSPVLRNSRLEDGELSKVWELSDIDADGKLDFEEFCITMRLIFDKVNGSGGIPSLLPPWLIPSLKAHLIEANQAVTGGSNKGIEYDDDEDGLSDDFDWYISPTDKLTYETIYNSNSDSYGRVKFDSLTSLYSSLKNVPRSDLSSAWNLVNPKSFETIDKDQALVYLHILNQREHGKRVPRGVPASLRATFSKEAPSYDLKSVQTKPTPSGGSIYSKKSFADNYLKKIGHTANERGTDFSSTEGVDWEEVRLRRELADLEVLLKKVQDVGQADDGKDLLKYEFEQLLKFKTGELESGGGDGIDLKSVKNDVELIESQVVTLEEFLEKKKQELESLKV
jgi:hypothetical protein